MLPWRWLGCPILEWPIQSVMRKAT
jgi:hypothetical protein